MKEIHHKILKNKLCFVFDFDGVIKDSVHVKTNAFEEMYRDKGKQISKQVKSYHLKNGGMSRFKKFRYYEESLLNKEISENKIKELSAEFSSIVKDKVINSNPIPGVIKFLDHLLKKDKILTINSATPFEELDDIVYQCKYNKYFKKIYGSPKSKIENLLLIMDDFDILSKDIVFFGDAESDFLAAKELKISFIGVGSYLKSIKLNQDIKYLLIDDFNELV